jgi:RimJ/RimL family protein N-acetyltransferase
MASKEWDRARTPEERHRMSRFEPALPNEHEPIAGPHDVSLRPIAEGDIEDLRRWRRDPEVMQFWGRAPDNIDEYREELFGRDTVPAWKFIIQWQGRAVGEIDYHHPHADTDSPTTCGRRVSTSSSVSRTRAIAASVRRPYARC